MITLGSKWPNGIRKVPRLRRVSYAKYDSEFGPGHPYIRLQGKYLEALGFAIGDTIAVDFEAHCITITKVLP